MNYNDKFKPKHTGIKFEELQPGVRYALTINPANLQMGNSRKILPVVHRSINTLRSLAGKSEMQLHIESSPLGKLHYHGYIRFSEDYVDTLCVIKDLMEYGTLCIKHLFEQEDEIGNKWEEYLIKQRHIWEPIFNETIHGYPFNISCTGNLPQQKAQEDTDAFTPSYISAQLA